MYQTQEELIKENIRLKNELNEYKKEISFKFKQIFDIVTKNELNPPNMTDEEIEFKYRAFGYKPKWSVFHQLWNHYLNNTYKDYIDAINHS